MAPKGFVDVEGWLVRETHKAILIDVEDTLKNGGGEHWLPKAEIVYDELGDGTVRVMLPEWLALRKGLI